MGIKLENITKKYKKKETSEYQSVLNDISLEIKSGELVAIRGKSGAGKSTLLHIIGLLDTMTTGKYFLDETNILELNDKELARTRNQKIGFILQDFGLIEEETVLYNVSLPLMFGKEKLKTIKPKAMEKLHKVGVEHLAEQKVSVLSGGEKQRVAIARALVNEPDFILADEPTGALDSKNAENIMRILKALNAEGKTVIVVTHDDMVANSCKRIIEIQDGKVYE